MRNELAKSIYEKANNDDKLFLVVGDSGLGVFDVFRFRHKDKFLNTGINEAASIGFCAGLALANKRPIYYNIAPFSIMRPYEQVRNDICYQELPVILIGTGEGMSYAPSGLTHYAIEDIGLALSMPNLCVFSPIDSVDAKLAFNWAYENQKPAYIRISKSNKIVHKDENYDILMPNFLKKNNHKKLLIGHGSILADIDFENIDADIISWCFINTPLSAAYDLLKNYDEIFVLEEHFSYGGLGTYLRDKTNLNIHSLALPNHYPHEILKQDKYREKLKLDNQNVANFINSF